LNSDKGTFIVIKDKDISIVLNAEEHLLIRIIKQGMLNQEDYKRFEEFEKILSDKFIFSASSRYGYLTANVKNSGLGLKLTVLVHLKGIAQSNKIDETIKLFSERGYGIIPLSFDKEHKETEYFKVITRLTFGVSELELLDDL
jgi:protein arginine kinase